MATYSVTHTETHDETKPAGSRARSLGDDDIREFKRAIRERLAIEHDFAADESGNASIGIHKQITMKALGSDPTTYTDVGRVYVKTVSGVIELFYKDSAGNVMQLTSNGVLLPFKSGDWIISTVTTARLGGWTNVSATYADKFMRINGTPLTTGGADTHNHGGETGSHVLTTDEIPAHTHSITGGTSAASNSYTTNAASNTDSPKTTGSAGGGGGHTHTLASANNVPAYVQVVVFQKD